MTKFERTRKENFFLPEGGVVPSDSEFGGQDGDLFAKLYVENTRDNMRLVRLFTDSWYDYKGLQQLIAELLYLKKEWETHPIFLESHGEALIPEVEEEEEDIDEIFQDEEDWLAEDVEPIAPLGNRAVRVIVDELEEQRNRMRDPLED